MIKAFIATLALSTLCIPQVEASTAVFTELDLLNHIEDIGGRVYIDSQYCQDNSVYGMQVGAQIHICAQAHGTDTDELRDTIRHEAWHLVQMCNEGPLVPGPVRAIAEAYKRGWTGEGYAPDDYHMEAEAHNAAAIFSAEDIKEAVDNYCLE